MLAYGLGLAGLLVTATLPVPVQAVGTILNLKDADLATLVQTVSAVTGKNYIIDPRVKAKVTIVSSRPLTASQLNETFLSVLEINGFAAVQAGGAIKIIPDNNAKTESTGKFGSGLGLPADDVVTHVYALQNVSATQLVPILRPLMPQWAHIAAYTANNTLVVADRAGNVVRLGKIIDRLDRTGDHDIQIVRLKNAPAAEITRIVSALIQQEKGTDPGAHVAGIIADERTNSVLISGDPLDRARVFELVNRLDMANPAPEDPSGNTQVVYLRFSTAETLAPILEGYAQTVQQSLNGSGSFNGVPGTPGSLSNVGSGATSSATTVTTSFTPGSGTGVFDRARIIADKETNSLIITAPPRVMRQIRNVITQLDIERAQVLVEAIIAEVSATQSVQLGVDFAAYNANAIATANILNPNTASAIANLGAASAAGTGNSSAALLGLLSLGGTAAIGRVASAGTSFAAILKALQADTSNNVLSFPSLLTLDNQEAKFSAGQEVPFQTGAFTSSVGSVSGGVVNPFQTQERKDVGLKIGVTPQISAGNRVKLKFTLEVSSIASGTAGSSNLITNKRTVSNTVAIEDGQVLVISGLVDDNLIEADNRVPVLGDIPYIGRLFQYRSTSKDKRNLMIFLHPVIIRGREASDYYTAKKYDGLRASQVQASISADGIVPLTGGRYPVIAPLREYQANSNRPGLMGTTAYGPVEVSVPTGTGRMQSAESLPSPTAALPQESIVLPDSATPRPDPLLIRPSPNSPTLPPSSRERIESQPARRVSVAPVLADPGARPLGRDSSPAAVTYIAPRAPAPLPPPVYPAAPGAATSNPSRSDYSR